MCQGTWCKAVPRASCGTGKMEIPSESNPCLRESIRSPDVFCVFLIQRNRSDGASTGQGFDETLSHMALMLQC